MTKAEKAAEEYVREKTFWVGEDDLWLAEANDCKKCFLAGVEWARKNPRWISVKERLPEVLQEVIVAYPPKVHGQAGWRMECWNWPETPVYEMQLITHWMSLPSKPEEE